MKMSLQPVNAAKVDLDRRANKGTIKNTINYNNIYKLYYGKYFK